VRIPVAKLPAVPDYDPSGYPRDWQMGPGPAGCIGIPPVQEDSYSMTGNDLPEKNCADSARRHILILEEEDRYTKPVQSGFGRAAGEYRLSLVRTVKEAREVLERDPPDLIIADWLLPDGRGIDILPRRNGRVTTPLIIMTRHGDAKLAVQLMKSGAIDYIVKSDLTFSDLPHIAGRALREWENIQERKRAEGMARESRKRLADIISFLPDATLAIDNGGHVIAWNHAIEQMTGIPAGEMMGKGDHEYSLPFYGERRPLLIDLVLADDPETEKKYFFIRRDGDRITSETFISTLNDGKGAYLWGTASPLYDSDGKRVGAIEAIRDITDRKQVERALQESELKFRTLVENVPDLILVHDGTKILYVNSAAPAITGYTEDEILGQPLTRFLAPEFSEKVASAVQLRMKGEQIGLYEVGIIKKSGSRMTVMVRGSRIDYAGSPALLNILTDITGRKRAENDLRQHEVFLNTLINTISSPIFYKDRNGLYTGCNTAFEHTMGIPKEQLAGKSVYDIWQKDLADVYSAKDRELLNHPGTQTYDGQIRYADGSLHDVIFNRATLAGPVGSVEGLVGVIQDISERKRSEEDLKKSQVQLGEAIDLAHLVNWEFDVRSGIFTFNDRFYALYGTTAEREGGYQMPVDLYTREFVHPDDQDIVAGEVEKAIQATDPQFISQVEHRIIRRDGEVRTIVVRFGITKDENSRTVRTHGANQDITEQKKMESALRESEVRFRSLIQNSSDIIRVVNASGRIMYDSPSSQRILGYPAGTLVGQDPLDFIHPDDLEQVRSDFTEVLHKKNTGTPTEFRIRKSDGSYIYVESVAVNLLDVPEINGIVVTTRPVNERKLAEISLRESEEKFRRIFDSANDGIIIVDITPFGLPGKIRDINAIQCTRLGYSRNELRNKTFSEIITPESNGKIPAFMAGLIAKGQAVFEAVFQTRDAGLLETEMSSHIIRFRDKDILIGIARDITRRKKEEQALRLANQKLQLMNIVAWHDIQNKITGLRGYVELSKDLVHDERARDFLMKEEAILKTIHASIQYTKEYQEMGTRPMQWVNIPSTIVSVLALIDKKGVMVSIGLDDLHIYCDPVIERVFSYLVENTINHGKKATAIRMWYEESPAGLTLIYTDDGVGIPSDSKESIFVRDVARGAGFSLYFIHDILELSGMSIRECGETGQGARFEIAVPKGSYRIGEKIIPAHS